MEEEHSFPVRSRHDSRAGMAEFDGAMAPGQSEAGRKRLFDSKARFGHAHVSEQEKNEYFN